MRKVTQYCDYCEKKIIGKNKIITTPWHKLILGFFFHSHVIIGGDGCRDCYESYKEWIKSRRR